MASQATSKRQYNLDLLRIASMFLIVLYHSIEHSGVLEAITTRDMHSSSIYVYFILAITKICVNCFVVLSGYLLIRSRFKLSKLVALWIETVVYSLLFKVLFMLTGSEPFSIVSLLSCFAPIMTGRYWFVTIYFGMYLLSPFLNAFIRALGYKNHTLLNLVLFLLMSVMSSLHPSLAGMNSGGGWGLAWFVVLYFLGAWFSLYYHPDYKVLSKFFLWILIPIFMVAALFFSKLSGIGVAVSITSNWFRYDSAPVYIATILFVVLFLNLHSPQSTLLCKLIGFISPLTFGVYLIHDHPDIRLWLWNKTMLAQHTHLLYFPLMQFAIVIGVFLLCIVIDSVRSAIFTPLEHSRKLAKISNDFTKSLVHLTSKFLSKDCSYIDTP